MNTTIKQFQKELQKIVISSFFQVIRFYTVLFVKITVAVVLTLAVFANIFISQTINPLYFNLITENRGAVVEFLKEVRFHPQFQQLLGMQERIYGKSLEQDIYHDEIHRKQLIDQLEEALKKNPQARDVLYSLYILYKQNNNLAKADEFLKKAQAVDPQLSE